MDQKLTQSDILASNSLADLVIARVFSHRDLEKLARSSQIPVINALSDLEHPCQILADLLTILECKKKLAGLKLAFIGDCQNNVASSLELGCSLMGIDFAAASPENYQISLKILTKSMQLLPASAPKILDNEN